MVSDDYGKEHHILMLPRGRMPNQGSTLPGEHQKFFGLYQGIVQSYSGYEGRVLLNIPQIGAEEIEAKACFQPGVFIMPGLGSIVWVMFEGGDPDFPVYMGYFPQGPTVPWWGSQFALPISPEENPLNPDSEEIEDLSGFHLNLERWKKLFGEVGVIWVGTEDPRYDGSAEIILNAKGERYDDGEFTKPDSSNPGHVQIPKLVDFQTTQRWWWYPWRNWGEIFDFDSTGAKNSPTGWIYDSKGQRMSGPYVREDGEEGWLVYDFKAKSWVSVSGNPQDFPDEGDGMAFNG